MKKIISSILAVTMLLSCFLGMTFTAHAAVMAKSWSQRTTSPDQYSSWILKYNTSNNCTRYVYGRMSEILDMPVSDFMGATCGADKFPQRLSAAGYTYGTTPKPGSVMCTSGHVAIVEAVNSNGSVLVSEGHSYSDANNIYGSYSVIRDGINYIGHSTLTKEPGKGSGTWFDFRTINTTSGAKYYYLVPDDVLYGPYITNFSIKGVSYNKITCAFRAENPKRQKIDYYRVHCRVHGTESWKGIKGKTSKVFTGNVNFTKSISDKYFSDGAIYDIRVGACVGGKWIYSYPLTVNTPAKTSIQNATVSTKKQKYNDGNNINVSSMISVSYGGRLLSYGTDYTLSLQTVRDIGNYNVTITGIGAYKGALTKKVQVYPKTPTLKSVTFNRTTGRIVPKWLRVANCTKQPIQVSTSSSFPKSSRALIGVAQSKQSCSIYSFTMNGKKTHVYRGKTYYVRMRAYKTVNGETIYGNWGATKKVVCK